LLNQVEQLEVQEQDKLIERSQDQENLFSESLESRELEDHLFPLSMPPKNDQEKEQIIQAVYKQTKGSLKDYYLSEFDDESETWNQYKKGVVKESEAVPRWNWGLISLVGLIFFAMMTIGGFFLYHYIEAKNDKEEIKAAIGVSDVAMALT